MSSIPQGQDLLFPEARLNNNLASGFNRAKLAWYVIDPLFLRNGSSTPDHIKNNPDEQSSHFVREIYENEIFPYRESPSGIPTNIPVLNLGFYPAEKGSYNFDTDPGPYSRGMDPDGMLNDPETRWGGIMREILTSDFETANIQYIKFWLMDPFVEDPDNEGGDLYFNLGHISEDILRDSRKSFENGLPGSIRFQKMLIQLPGEESLQFRLLFMLLIMHLNRDYTRMSDLMGWEIRMKRSFFTDYLQKAQAINNS